MVHGREVLKVGTEPLSKAGVLPEVHKGDQIHAKMARFFVTLLAVGKIVDSDPNDMGPPDVCWGRRR